MRSSLWNSKGGKDSFRMNSRINCKSFTRCTITSSCMVMRRQNSRALYLHLQRTQYIRKRKRNASQHSLKWSKKKKFLLPVMEPPNKQWAEIRTWVSSVTLKMRSKSLRKETQHSICHGSKSLGTTARIATSFRKNWSRVIVIATKINMKRKNSKKLRAQKYKFWIWMNNFLRRGHLGIGKCQKRRFKTECRHFIIISITFGFWNDSLS